MYCVKFPAGNAILQAVTLEKNGCDTVRKLYHGSTSVAWLA